MLNPLIVRIQINTVWLMLILEIIWRFFKVVFKFLPRTVTDIVMWSSKKTKEDSTSVLYTLYSLTHMFVKLVLLPKTFQYLQYVHISVHIFDVKGNKLSYRHSTYTVYHRTAMHRSVSCRCAKRNGRRGGKRCTVTEAYVPQSFRFCYFLITNI